MTWLAVAAGGVVGAVLRDVVQRRMNPPAGSGLPRATLVINLSGALFLGLVVGWAREGTIGPDVALLLGVGFCGAFTTWSGYMWEWLQLVKCGRARLAWAYLGGSLAAGIALAALGIAVAKP